MRLGGRLAAAIEVLAAIDAQHRPVAEALKDWARSHRFAGVQDRAAIGNLVYDALRWRSSLAFAMGGDTPRALVLGVAGRHWGLGVEGLARTLAEDPHAPAPLDPAEAERIAAPLDPAAPGHVRADVPEWLAPRFAATFGEAWVEEGAALALRPPLDLRVNRLKADRERAQKALARYSPAETRCSPDGLRIAPTAGDARHPNLEVEPPFQKGWFEIQDEGSQLATLLVGARPGEQVLDLCAGGGGKTLALASVMGNKGQVHATDADRVRLAPIFERLKRAGTRNVQVHEAGAPLDDLRGRMDRVLIDAPCTGSGTWRRRPDAKWRLSERALDQRLREQAALLDEAAAFVKPGGTLTYVTCSVIPDENAGQVEAFLARRPEFAAVPPADAAASAALAPDFIDAAYASPIGLQMTPRRTGTDGFFVSTLRQRVDES
ncbi:MAG: RsmB/NOP family class I SAM-dependent RNA methyltransferase [Bauldia sp.]|nr:RsmB/NOP family class I SAM-dependent RNA methyltransferase [Bauldia sp.]